jgi:excisionase family DNA binding protein
LSSNTKAGLRKSAVEINESLSIDRVAELLSVHRSTIERLLEKRALGYFQVGRRRVIGHQHLREYLASVERKANSAFGSTS